MGCQWSALEFGGSQIEDRVSKDMVAPWSSSSSLYINGNGNISKIVVLFSTQ